MAFDLPPQAGPERDNAILEHVRSGDIQIVWGRISSQDKDNRIDLAVFADAMKIDGVRINVTAENQQQIADLLGCMLMTPQIMDMIWKQRHVTLPPLPMPIASTTEAMVKQSQRIDAELAKQGNPPGIVSTVGKAWVIDEDLKFHPGTAENYGWQCDAKTWTGSTEACVFGGCRVVQGRGWRHDPRHTDYSQNCALVARKCVVNGQPDDLARVLTDKTLAHLVSHSGPMTILRQPGVPELPPLARAPGKPGAVIPVDWKQETGSDRGTDWGAVAIGAAGLGLVLGGFWLAMKGMPTRNLREIGGQNFRWIVPTHHRPFEGQERKVLLKAGRNEEILSFDAAMNRAATLPEAKLYLDTGLGDWYEWRGPFAVFRTGSLIGVAPIFEVKRNTGLEKLTTHIITNDPSSIHQMWPGQLVERIRVVWPIGDSRWQNQSFG